MQIDWWTLLLQTINFLVLVWLLQRFLYRPVLAVIDRRREETESLIDAAKQAREDAERERQGLAAERQSFAEERDNVLANAKRDADEIRDSLIVDAHEDIDRMRSDAKAKILREREDATVELRRHATTLAVDLADHILRTVARSNLDDAFFDAALAALRNLPEEELDGLRQAIGGDDTEASIIHIVSARPPSADQKVCYLSAIAELLGAKPTLSFAVDDDLIAGVELHLPHTIVHYSARSVLDGAAHDIDDDDAAPRS